jgi:hypothetical protein
MPQAFLVDRLKRTAYLAVCLLGCRPVLPPLLPAGLEAVDAGLVMAWVDSTRLTERTLLRFTWLFREEKASKGGRGAVRFAPPDTIRLDFQGSLGIGRGSALLIGDTAIWMKPSGSIEDLVPAIRPAAGHARLPAAPVESRRAAGRDAA